MNLCIPTTLALLLFMCSANAGVSMLPVQILCTPDEYHRTGIEKLDLPGDTAHLFQYGGKVTITQNSKKRHFSYGAGQDFYTLKNKTAYSKDFVDIAHEILLISDPEGTERSGQLFLRGEMGDEFFQVDWTKQRYYGYTHKSGAIHSYAGSCVVLRS